ncbi:C25 family cysteine peptidase, partial [Candidatus Cloacimonadota bacterium]
MRKLAIIFFLVISISVFASWVEVNENQNKQLIEVQSNELERSQISFNLNGYELEPVQINGNEFQLVSLPDENELTETGKPSLPYLSRILAVPATGNLHFEIIAIEQTVISNIELLPRQSIDSAVKSENGSFIKNEEFYATGSIYPIDLIELTEPGIMRGVRVASFSINPFQYDPKTKELTIVTNLTFEVTADRDTGINPVEREMMRSRFFEPILESSLINYETLSGTRDVEYQQPCLLIIYADEELLTLDGGYNLQDVINWKRQKGFDVQTASLDDIGTSAVSIENYIADAYEDWENPPEFVCLVGDPSSYYDLPASSSGYGSTDHYYSLIEGNDVLADVLIGRLSVDASNDMKVIANKILGYEKTPFMDNVEWYKDVLLVGDPSSSGPSCISTCKFVKETILDYDDTFTFNEYYSGGAATFFTNAMNGGVSFFAYRGYLGMSSIPGAISGVNNGWMMPFVSCITCGTGGFDGECTSESFLEAGSANLPKAAIAAVGTATAGTMTMYNNIVTGGMFHGIFHDGIYNPGGALVRGKLALYDNYNGTAGESGSQNFFYWNNLMGDPSIELWTGVPQPLTVSYNNDISVGTNYLEVYVQDFEGQALANAWVTAYSEDMGVFATEFTDNSGLVYLPVNVDVTGSFALTVTSHNGIPHLGDVDVIQSSYFLAVDDYTLDDDMSGNSNGNGDSVLNPGETIELGLGIINSGDFQVEGVTATLSSSDENVTILNSTSVYGDIAAGSTVTTNDLQFSVSYNALNGTFIEMSLEMTNSDGSTWTDLLFIPVTGPDLLAVDYIVSDGNNGVLEPGETSNFKVLLRNDGDEAVNGITGVLGCYDERITINDPDGTWNNIAAGQQLSNATDMFNISANSAILNGSQISMYLDLTTADGMLMTLSFNIEIGVVSVADPLGPDAYGYYCYDDEDAIYPDCPEYNWIEIDPDASQPDYTGTIIDINMYSYPHSDGGSGDIQNIDLPPDFTFQFYGIIYDEISICSNGYIIPGYSENFEFMNWHIPGPMSPSPMIAPFWDELHMDNSSNVVYYYNQSEHYLVVEWSNMENSQSHDETFQAILYDANFYNTTTNDSKIKFQYKEINNTDVNYTGYPHNHGQYATVGITDHTNNIG